MSDDEPDAYFGTRQSAKGLLLVVAGFAALLVSVMALAFGVAQTEFALPTFGLIAWAVIAIGLGLRGRGEPLPKMLWWLSHLWLAIIFGTFAYVQLAGKYHG